MKPLSRREFVRTAATVAAVGKLVSSARAAEASAPDAPVRSPDEPPTREGAAPVRWLDGRKPALVTGATVGVPWPRGKMPKDASFALQNVNGAALPVQSWPLAYWPDGTLKWTAHAVTPDASNADGFEILAGSPAQPRRALSVTESADMIEVDTGIVRCAIATKGSSIMSTIERDGREIARDGRLVLIREDRATKDVVREEGFTGEISSITVEQRGPVRAVVRIEGSHVNGDAANKRALLRFTVRMYFHAGSDAVRVMHTIIFDGDENKDFIRGLGLRFSVPMRGACYDRHVRFSGQDAGLFAEAIQGLTGLRRDPGRDVREAQLAGRATPPVESWDKRVSTRLQYIPAFGDWTLFQANADGFELRKRTREGFTWLNAAQGGRAGGLGYVGTPRGGVAFGIRNFWQSHPAQFDIRGATGDAAEVTAWLWAPDAPAMDLRAYHDTMGEDTYEKQNEGLEITYEDYEPGFDTPHGVARTSEFFLWALAATPAREDFVKLDEVVRTPPMLVTTPSWLHACDVFGGMWSPADRSTPAHAAIEKRLDQFFSFYEGQREQRRWYGYWNFGDVMHSYDADRHVWKYDVGGFAWDNSELSTDIWLWLSFLRTGRADVFRFAEAMTRHTGEVDVYHIGRFAPLGSRHNVLHWGCSAKQLRISTAANRRYYYYLTGDERVGDLMREQIDAARRLVDIQPTRKLAFTSSPGDVARDASKESGFAGVGFGTDWGAISSAWLTEWERTGEVKMRDRLIASMRSIGRQPRGFFSTGSQMNLNTGEFDIVPNDRVNVSHLSAAFGLPEVCAELVQLLDVPEFTKAWLDYCELYNASPEEQRARLGQALKGINLQQGHARLTAYAAKQTRDPALAKRAWSEFFRGDGGFGSHKTTEVSHLVGPAVMMPVDEIPWISTNATAQWGLSAIECLALAGAALPESS